MPVRFGRWLGAGAANFRYANFPARTKHSAEKEVGRWTGGRAYGRPLARSTSSGQGFPWRVATFQSRAPKRRARRGGRSASTCWVRPGSKLTGRSAGPRGWKAWALLAYLILTNAPVPRERLAELLFADADDPLEHSAGTSPSCAGRSGLRSRSAAIRSSWRCLPTRLSTSALGSATWVEAVQVPALGQDLLEGIDVQAGAAFETWPARGAAPYREHLRRGGFARPPQRVSRWAGRTRRSPSPRLVALDETTKEANILMIRTYLAIGAEPRAREHLESAAARIRDELGTEPPRRSCARSTTPRSSRSRASRGSRAQQPPSR